MLPNIQLNLQRTSLEEAYKRFEKNNSNNQSLSSQPSESFFQSNLKKGFFQQLQSIMLYRYYRLIMDKRELLTAIFLPIFADIILVILFDRFKYHPFINPKTGTMSATVCAMTVNYVIAFYLASISVESIIIARENSRILQKAMSMKALPYWLGNLLVDFALFLPLIFGGITFEIIITEIEESIAVGKFKYYYAIWSFYIIISSYNLSRWFKSSYSMPPAMFAMFASSIYFMDKSGTAFGAFNSLEGILQFSLFFIPQLPLIPVPTQNLPVNMFAAFIHFSYLVYKDSQPFYSKSKITPPNSQTFTSSTRLLNEEIQRVQNEDNQDYVKIIHGSKTYTNNGCEALKDVTFGVETGKIFCLLGPNGAGKTTTLNTLSNVIPLTSGSVQVNNQELYGIPDPDYAPGICFQTDMLWEVLTVEQHLEIYALLKGIPRENVAQNVEEVILALGLEPHKDKPVQNLSGGTKRKLSVAISVIGAPKLIILDEPTTGVDPIGRNQIWTFVKNLANKRRSTVLISTHYMEDVELVADKLGILVNGRLKVVGNVSDIRAQEEEHFLTIEGISNGFVPFLDSKIREILPEARLTENSNEEKRIFKVPSTAMRFAAICSELEEMAQSRKISEFSINVKTLEQAFLEYAKEQN